MKLNKKFKGMKRERKIKERLKLKRRRGTSSKEIITGVRRIDRILEQTALERGELAEKKVSQILKNWQAKRWILGHEMSSKWGYDDSIRRVDGFIVTLEGEMLEFQVKSSFKVAQEFREKYPNLLVICAPPQEDIELIDERMQEVFKERLPVNL